MKKQNRLTNEMVDDYERALKNIQKQMESLSEKYKSFWDIHSEKLDADNWKKVWECSARFGEYLALFMEGEG